MEETIRKFKEHLRKMDAYNHAFGVLSYDSETAMPKGGSEHLGMTYAVLSEEMYKLTTSPDLKAWVKEILEHKEQVDYITRREAEELHEDMERTEKIPMEEYVAFQVAQNAASHAWHTAKVTNDFALFAPHLETLVNYSRKFAGYWDSAKAPYDVLLDMYEKGLTMATLDEFFALLRKELLPVVEAVVKKGPVVAEEDLLRACSDAFESGWTGVKLYFMIGLPTETDEDVLGIAELAKKVSRLFYAMPKEKRGKGLRLTVSVSTFVPKPHTAFQWCAQNDPEEIRRKQRLLVGAMKGVRGGELHYHLSFLSVLEAAFGYGCGPFPCPGHSGWREPDHREGGERGSIQRPRGAQRKLL